MQAKRREPAGSRPGGRILRSTEVIEYHKNPSELSPGAFSKIFPGLIDEAWLRGEIGSRRVSRMLKIGVLVPTTPEAEALRRAVDRFARPPDSIIVKATP